MDDGNPSLIIRRATPDDADAIARLHHLSHTTSFRPFVPAEWVVSRDVDAYRREWRGLFAASDEFLGAWIALEGRDMVGIMSAKPLPDDPAHAGRRMAVIRSVHVHPQRIGFGIARQLWACVVAFLRVHGFAHARVQTIAANVRSRRFVEAAGCRLVRIVPRGAEGVPQAVYELALDASARTYDEAGPPNNGMAPDPLTATRRAAAK